MGDSKQELAYLLDQTAKVQAEETKICLFKNMEDGYRWEGYGSRRLADGTPNRKSYYRCVNVRASQGCPAKKVLQEHPDDSRLVIVTYKGAHTHEPLKPSTSLHPIFKLLHYPPPTVNMDLFDIPAEVIAESRSRTHSLDEVSEAIKKKPDLLSAIADFAINSNPLPLIDVLKLHTPKGSLDSLRESMNSTRHHADVEGPPPPAKRSSQVVGFGVVQGGSRNAQFDSVPHGLMSDNLFARHLSGGQPEAQVSPVGQRLQQNPVGLQPFVNSGAPTYHSPNPPKRSSGQHVTSAQPMEVGDAKSMSYPASLSDLLQPSLMNSPSMLGKRPREMPQAPEKSAFDVLLEAAATNRTQQAQARLAAHQTRSAMSNSTAITAAALRRYEPMGTGMPIMNHEDPVIEMDDGHDPRRAVDEKSRSLPSLSSFFI